MFDTTGVGYFEVRKGYEPELETLQAMLVEGNLKAVKLTRLTEVDVPVAAQVYELSISGLG